MDATSNQCSTDYDPITGRPRYGGTTSPTSRTGGAGSPMNGTGGSVGSDRTKKATHSGSGKVGGGGTCAQQSTDYDPLMGGTGSNIDANQSTAIGIEIKERFRDMRTAFLKVDSNRDGRITKKELISMCRNWNIPTSEAERVLGVADLDENGTLDFNEFAQRFDPFDGENNDGTGLASTRHNAADDRPIGGARRSPAEERPIGGSGGERSMPSSPTAGGGGHGAARALASGGNSDAFAQLQQENSELKSENAQLRAQNAKLQAALEAAVGGGGGGGGAQSSGGGGGGGGMEMTRAPVSRELPPEESAEDAAARAREMSTVFIYGKRDDPQTAAMQKALKAAGIPFETRDFDKDKDKYQDALDASGFRGGKLSSPIVVLGHKAWWDDGSSSGGDDMFCFPFPTQVASELRQFMGVGLAAFNEPVPVRTDADIDTEIAERFSSMQQAFLKLDANRDGKISKKELIEKCKEWNIYSTEAQRALDEADYDENGALDFNEFARRFNGHYNMSTNSSRGVLKGSAPAPGHSRGRR